MGAIRTTLMDLITFVLLLSMTLLAFLSTTQANPDAIAADMCPGTGPSDSRLACLAEAYAPLLKFDSFEAYFPSSVDDFLPYMKIINADGFPIPDQPDPLSASNLEKQSDTPFTTFLTTKTPLASETAIDDRFMLGVRPSAQTTVPIYASIVRKQEGLLYDLVYYAFYPYNQGKRVGTNVYGNHVGDWEHNTLRLSFADPLQPRLTRVFLAAHGGGKCHDRGELAFVAGTAHPIFYVAKGSHGLYNCPGKTVYNAVPLLVDEHNGRNAVKWETWRSVAVRVEGQPLPSEYTFWSFNGRWGNRRGTTMAFGQYVLAEGPPYPGSNAQAFQLDNPEFSECSGGFLEDIPQEIPGANLP